MGCIGEEIITKALRRAEKTAVLPIHTWEMHFTIPGLADAHEDLDLVPAVRS